MSEKYSPLKDHWLLAIFSIFGIGFGAAWFLAQEVVLKPSEKVTTLQTEITTLRSAIEESKGTIAQLNQSLDTVLREKRDVQMLYENTAAEAKQTQTVLKDTEDHNRTLQTELDVLKNNYAALEGQINPLKEELKQAKDARIAQEAIYSQKEKQLTEQLNKECIAKVAIQKHREEQILSEIESLKKECQNQQLVEEILKKYRQNVATNP